VSFNQVLKSLVWLSVLSASGAGADGVKLTILHTNDHHGHVLKSESGVGGVAARATLVEKIRTEVKQAGGHVLLLDAGDVNSGTAISNLLKAEPDFRAMKLLGYDAMTIGNHEFDVPLAALIKQREWAGFPFLSANIEILGTDKNEVPWIPYLIKTVGDKKIALLGLTTAETPLVSHPDKVRGYQFNSPVEIAKKLVPTLEEKADYIIALTHLGYYGEEGAPLEVESDVDLAKSAPGIDLIIGGHSHTALFQPARHHNIPIFQAGEYGKYLGRIDLQLNDDRMEVVSSELIPIDDKDGAISESPAMLKSLEPLIAQSKPVLEVQIGTLGAPGLDGNRNVVRSRASAIGTLIAQAFRETLRLDVGLMNGGGIRSSFKAGNVTHGDLISVLPFPDSLVVVIMSGEEISQYLKFVLENFRVEGSGSFPHLSGVSATFKEGKVVDLKIDGKAIDSQKKYHLGLPEFLAKGGDKYPMLSDKKGYSKTGYTSGQALTEFWERKKTIQPEEWEKAAEETLER